MDQSIDINFFFMFCFCVACQAGLECNKGGSGRTIDLNIHTHDDEQHCFGMIEKEEIKPLQIYIQMILKRGVTNTVVN